jgi:glycine dehydrogenase subunit 1
MIGGFPLGWHYPELGNAALWCCTEMNSKEQIDTAVQVVGQ